MTAVRPVHEREEGDAASKEAQQHKHAVSLMQPAILEAQIQEEGEET